MLLNVLHIFRFFNTEFKIIYLFFKNDRVHAWTGETTLRYFDKIFLEGHAYVIKNFIVKYYEPSEINRCFKDEQHIILSCSTRAYPLKEEIGNIPFNGWKFTDLGKLNDFDDNINHFIGEICKFSLLNQFIDTYDPYISPSYLSSIIYIDVIGLIYSVDPAQCFPTHGRDDGLLINFCITDNM